MYPVREVQFPQKETRLRSVTDSQKHKDKNLTAISNAAEGETSTKRGNT